MNFSIMMQLMVTATLSLIAVMIDWASPSIWMWFRPSELSGLLDSILERHQVYHNLQQSWLIITPEEFIMKAEQACHNVRTTSHNDIMTGCSNIMTLSEDLVPMDDKSLWYSKTLFSCVLMSERLIMIYNERTPHHNVKASDGNVRVA